MNIITILGIAVGLSMDAFAVAVACGFSSRNVRVRDASRIAIYFGLFQAIMPILGWASGLCIKDVIQNLDHWIAFGLLSIIGGKMIYESFSLTEEQSAGCNVKTLKLLGLSVATSIDALAVGLSLSFLNIKIALPSLIIGAITFTLSFAGVFLGKRFGHLFEKKIEVLGGLILIGIGVKILLEHML